MSHRSMHRSSGHICYRRIREARHGCACVLRIQGVYRGARQLGKGAAAAAAVGGGLQETAPVGRGVAGRWRQRMQLESERRGERSAHDGSEGGGGRW